MSLDEMRSRIDAIDGQLSSLLTERMKHGLEIARIKESLHQPTTDRMREREILTDLVERCDPEFEEYLKVLFSVLFDMSKSYQIRSISGEGALAAEILAARKGGSETFPKRATVACQGIEGAYSQQAAERLFSLPKIVYFRNFESVFRAVGQGMCQYGILPIENSTFGSVLPVYDLMKDHHFHIVRSIKMTISHSLLAKPSTKLDQIHEILSHPQALGQCSAYLERHPDWIQTAVENTAIAARRVAESSRNDWAAIASNRCAELYGLTVLDENLENNGNNFTRFICISRGLEIYPGANRISLILTLPHRSGALYSTLAKFAAIGLNLTKLESRPIPGKDFEFLFYFDLETPSLSDELIRLLDHCRKTLSQFAFLGFYSEI